LKFRNSSELQNSFQVPILLQAGMAQQGKQMKIGAREDFIYHFVKLVLLANVNRYEIDSDGLLQVAVSPRR
jgi:hypothetical protein